MMSSFDEHKILDRLANDRMTEMNADDLEQILNAELDKPADEIDTLLVQEILQSLQIEEPDPERMKADWQRVKAHLPHRQTVRRWPRRLIRFGAAAAAITIVMFSALRDAEAFRWTLIQKLLKPVAETFGIMIDDQNNVAPETPDMSQYSVSDAPSTLVTFATLDEVPEMHEGYIIRPKWIPDGYQFVSGSHFSSMDSEIYSLDFIKDEAWFNLNVHIVTFDSTSYHREFERTLEVPIEKTIKQHTVTFYHNAENAVQSALWIYENAHYMISGEISVDDITYFVEYMQ